MVKNLPAMRETWVRFLGQEDPLEKGMATHSSILTTDREAWWATVHGISKSQTRLSKNTFSFHFQNTGEDILRLKSYSLSASDHPAKWGC